MQGKGPECSWFGHERKHKKGDFVMLFLPTLQLSFCAFELNLLLFPTGCVAAPLQVPYKRNEKKIYLNTYLKVLVRK